MDPANHYDYFRRRLFGSLLLASLLPTTHTGAAIRRLVNGCDRGRVRRVPTPPRAYYGVWLDRGNRLLPPGTQPRLEAWNPDSIFTDPGACPWADCLVSIVDDH